MKTVILNRKKKCIRRLYSEALGKMMNMDPVQYDKVIKLLEDCSIEPACGYDDYGTIESCTYAACLSLYKRKHKNILTTLVNAASRDIALSELSEFDNTSEKIMEHVHYIMSSNGIRSLSASGCIAGEDTRNGISSAFGGGVGVNIVSISCSK